MQLFSISRKTQVRSRIIAATLIVGINFTPLSSSRRVSVTAPPHHRSRTRTFSPKSTQPKIDGASGAFTQRIPLDIPPGRNGLQPDVTLDYNSQRTQDSIVGYGWQLSIPYIQRLNKTGSQDLYGNTPYFTSSFDGELANTSTTSSATASSSLTNNLNAYWKFDESSAATPPTPPAMATHSPTITVFHSVRESSIMPPYSPPRTAKTSRNPRHRGLYPLRR